MKRSHAIALGIGLAILLWGIGLAAVLWLVLSGIASFTDLQWTSITANAAGRRAFAVVWLLFMLVGIFGGRGRR